MKNTTEILFQKYSFPTVTIYRRNCGKQNKVVREPLYLKYFSPHWSFIVVYSR